MKRYVFVPYLQRYKINPGGGKVTWAPSRERTGFISRRKPKPLTEAEKRRNPANQDPWADES